MQNLHFYGLYENSTSIEVKLFSSVKSTQHNRKLQSIRNDFHELKTLNSIISDCNRNIE